MQNKGQNDSEPFLQEQLFQTINSGYRVCVFTIKLFTLKTKAMGILSWILLGLVAGAIAKALHPGRDPQGCIVTMIIGIIGAVLGGWIATQFGWGTVNGFNLYSILVATGGAVLALAIYTAITGRRRY